MRFLPQHQVFCKCPCRDVGQSERAGAELQIVVFQLERPAAPQRVFHAGAHGPAVSARAGHLVEQRGDLSRLEIVGMGKRSAALEVKQCRIVRVANPPGYRSQPVFPGPTGIIAVRAQALVLQVAPGGVAFCSEHPLADLIIDADLTAEQSGIAGFRYAPVDQRPIAVGNAGTDMAADINAGPVIGENGGGGLAHGEGPIGRLCPSCTQQHREYRIGERAPAHNSLRGTQIRYAA